MKNNNLKIYWFFSYFFKKLMNKLLLFLLIVLLFVFTACENQSTLRNTAEDDGCYVKYGVIAIMK